MSNKVKFGFKNAYYAVLTNDGYATPVKIDGAVSMSLSPSGDTTEFYADDGLYFSDENNNGYEGTIEFALIPDTFKTACLGMVKDSNGVIEETSNAVNTPFALLCEFTGDEKSRRFVFYHCVATRPDLGATTKGESVEVQTETLNITIRPNTDGIVKCETSEDTSTSVYEGWYSDVYTALASA